MCPTNFSHFNEILTTILGSKTVDGIISLRLLADETRKSIGGEATGVTTAGIDLTDVDLDGSVVLGSDQTVSGGAKERKKEYQLINNIKTTLTIAQWR